MDNLPPDAPAPAEDLFHQDLLHTQPSGSNHPSDISHHADDELTLSETSESPAILSDHDVDSEENEILDQSRRPRVGDVISYFDSTTSAWVEARITHNLSKRYDRYYNIITTDGRRDGLYLLPDTRWTFLSTPIHDTPEEQRLEDNISSLEPSPSLLTPIATYHSAPNLADVLDTGAHSDDQDPQKSPSTPSLDWDYASTCESPSYFHGLPLDRVMNLDSVLPLPSHLLDGTSPINLLEAQNLEQYLPLTSTPLSPRPRISNLRRLLPLERERVSGVSIPSFLHCFCSSLFVVCVL